MQDTLLNFQKFFLFPKVAAILNFRQKWLNLKLLVSPKLLKFLAQRVYMLDTLLTFQKKFPLSKSGGHFEFSNF